MSLFWSPTFFCPVDNITLVYEIILLMTLFVDDEIFRPRDVPNPTVPCTSHWVKSVVEFYVIVFLSFLCNMAVNYVTWQHWFQELKIKCEVQTTTFRNRQSFFRFSTLNYMFEVCTILGRFYCHRPKVQGRTSFIDKFGLVTGTMPSPTCTLPRPCLDLT